MLAKKAAELKPSGYILDTLATAWWANGYPEQAIATEKHALAIDPGKAEYYQSQIVRFQTSEYTRELDMTATGDIPERSKHKEEGENALSRRS